MVSFCMGSYTATKTLMVASNATLGRTAVDMLPKFNSKRSKKMNPTEQNTKPEPIVVSKSVFDLDTFADVTLVKPVDFTAATSTEEALSRLGGDTAKLLSVINEGLLEVRKREVKADASAWMQEVENEDGTTALEAFDGTIADQKMVNNLVLNIAKSSFGYNKAAAAKDKAGKAKAKQAAMDFVSSNEVLKNGLKENAQ
jgi:hypothetical protein